MIKYPLDKRKTQSVQALGFSMCARHGTVLTGASPVTGIYRQV